MNKIYLQQNLVQLEDGTTKAYYYFDIGQHKDNPAKHTYRVWVNLYVSRDNKGFYINFPMHSAVIEKGKHYRTLIMKHRKESNVFNHIIQEEGINYKLDTDSEYFKYYVGTNEGLLVVSKSTSIDIYFEDKSDIEKRGIVTMNTYGFEEKLSLAEYELVKAIPGGTEQ